MIELLSLQSLFIQMQYDGVPTSSGTAFVYQANGIDFLVTNRHNVTGRHQESNVQLNPNAPTPNELLVMHHKKGTTFSWVPCVEPLYDVNGKALWFEHPNWGTRMDCVCIRLTHVNDVETHPYNQYDNYPRASIGPADVVSVIGFPFGLTGGGLLAIWATGFIATEPTIDFMDLPLMLIDCRGRPGQSGSPVVAARSGVVAMEDGTNASKLPFAIPLGIYSGRINDQSDLGMVWKMEAVRELVRHAAQQINTNT